MNSREIILKALYDIEEKGEYFNNSLSSALSKCENSDKGFVTEIIYGVIKNKLALDYIIMQFSSVKLKKMTPWVKNIMRMGIYQMFYMDKIPHSAACNESVKLSKKYAHAASGRFINGVLRNVSRNIDAISFPDSKNQEEYLSIKYSYPIWMVKKLLLQYGFDCCEKFMAESNKSHNVNLRVNTLKKSSQEVLSILKNEGIIAEISTENPNCINVIGQININNSEAYNNGFFSLQNISSYKAIEVLDPKPNDLVIDMCAAPGGKSCAAAEKMENKGEIYAFDIYEHKTKLIENSASRLGIHIIKTRVHDGQIEMPDFFEKADKVILDAPCSGLGVIHKKPDIKWTRQETDIAELSIIQSKLLDVASKYLKVGGEILYSTCTILAEENQDITKKFLKTNHNFSKEFEKQILTDGLGESGFYICKIKRNK